MKSKTQTKRVAGTSPVYKPMVPKGATKKPKKAC
jgi:hypothetical protein